MIAEKENEEDDVLVEECAICAGDIIVDGYCEEEDIVYCNDCEAEYMIRSLDPLSLTLLNDDLESDLDESPDKYDEDYD
jgi:alpha-aminoadipate carrier protein LysW